MPYIFLLLITFRVRSQFNHLTLRTIPECEQANSLFYSINATRDLPGAVS